MYAVHMTQSIVPTHFLVGQTRSVWVACECSVWVIYEPPIYSSAVFNACSLLLLTYVINF